MRRMFALERERRMDLRHDGGAFADRRRHPFGRTRADIADREHAGPAGLERQGRATGSAGAVCEVEAGEDEALGIHGRAVWRARPRSGRRR
mgnify:CR=1 FL=1